MSLERTELAFSMGATHRYLLTAVCVMALSSPFPAAAQIPDEFRGLWTSEKNNCTGYYSDGVTVLGVTGSEISWYEIVCAPVEVSRSGNTLRLDANCEKVSYRYTGTIKLEILNDERLKFRWEDVHGGYDEIVWKCPARHQASFARNTHPTSGSYLNETTSWDHNGSKMALEASGSMRRFVYVKPREGMLVAGASEGDILFNGRVRGNEYRGIAYIFNKRCGTFSYRVRGPISADYRNVVIVGKAPHINSKCEVAGYRNDRLEFNLLDDPDNGEGISGDPNGLEDAASHEGKQ